MVSRGSRAGWKGIPLDRVVAVVARLANGREQVGSGYLVNGRLVLTAEHCTRDDETGQAALSLQVRRASDGKHAEAKIRAASQADDVAVLDLSSAVPWPADLLPRLRFGRVDRTCSGELSDCEALGFPHWQLDPLDHQRNHVAVKGTIRLTEDVESDYLVLRDAELATVSVPNTADPQEGASGSRWGGLSGALMFHAGTALGVVVQHCPRQGASAIRLVPFDRVSRSSNKKTGAIAEALGLPELDDLHWVPGATSGRRVGSIPRLAECFQDRETIGRLSCALDHEKMVVLAGTGGVGKTQLAAHYATHASHHHPMDLVMWTTVASRQDVLDRYAQAGVDVAGDESGDKQQAVEGFLRWLENTSERWLVVLDDVANPTDLDGLWPSDHAQGRVLVTTRRRDPVMTGEGRFEIDVSCFSPGEAAAYLTAKLAAHHRDDDHEQIAGLAEDLGRLPLALAQAAAYLVETGRNCGSYRARFANLSRSLRELEPSCFPDDYPKAVAVTVCISITRADQLRPEGLARPMLELASMLAPNGIPVDVLTSKPALDYLTARTAEPAVGRRRDWDADDASDALKKCLRLLSLAEVDESDRVSRPTVRVHSLTQRAIREVLIVEDRCYPAARAAADALMVSWPKVDQDTIQTQVLRANTDALLVCSGEALWQGGVHPLLLRAGHSFGEAGMVSAAFIYWKQLHDTAVSRLGVDHPDTAAIWSNRLHWTAESGDIDSAIAGYTHLLADRRQSLSDEQHPDVLQARDDLAHWHGEAGHRAYVQISQAAEERKSQTAPKHESQVAVDQMFQAAAEYAALLVDRRRLVGADHPDTLRSLSEQAHWLAEAAHAARHLGGDGAERMQHALDLYAELLAIQRGLGDESAVLVALGHLAHWAGENGDAVLALDRYTELLTAQQHVLGGDHPETLKTRDHLAHWTGENGDVALAIDHYTELLTAQQRVLDEDHPDCLHTRERIAHWRARSGDLGTAIREYTAVLVDQRRVLGEDHPDTQWTARELARLRQQEAF